MADDFNILIRNCDEIERVALAIGEFLGHPLPRMTSVEWKLYKTRSVGFEISVFEADDFENDAGIEFEKYPLMVGVDGLSIMTPVEHFDEWFRLFSLTLASIISRKLECECLLVKNFCHVVASFPASASGEQRNPAPKAGG
ncbi:MAG TPA: hypothetical protein VFJ58_14365 [Armatimonadota bacterium]|nr:hypothetical protein [Armatimonadota bacterium]